MRMNFAAALLLATATTGFAAAPAAPAGDVISPLSLRFAGQGQAALDKGQPVAAIDAFETALAADPKNAAAYVGIAKAYEAQGMPGKAVKYYREALGLDPNDLGALEGQGLALVARGATARAQVNLERIKTLCKTDCAPAKRLEVAMASAAAAPKTAVAEVTKVDPAKPVAAKN